MENKAFTKYYILSLSIALILSCYPLYMGIRVVSDMIKNGTVLAENYPKYIIPYTPISLAVIFGVLLMPVIIKLAKRIALLTASALSLAVFFVSELLLESQVIITTTVKTTLESWQMYMCYVPRAEIQTAKAIDVLIGNYSPTFKIHFYIISIVLILSLLNCFYGFAKAVLSNNRQKMIKPLILQTVSSVLFLGLCIFACFTAFYRTGDLHVSVLSAFLMSIFFVIFGLTMGIYVGSFLFGKKRILSVTIPAITSSVITLTMYIGEMFLLSGNLYRFGTGVLFDSIAGITFAPIDLIIIVISGIICGFILKIANSGVKLQ